MADESTKVAPVQLAQESSSNGPVAERRSTLYLAPIACRSAFVSELSQLKKTAPFPFIAARSAIASAEGAPRKMLAFCIQLPLWA